MEARLRAVEAVSYHHINTTPDHAAVLRGLEALDGYHAVRLALPEGTDTSNLGSPHSAVTVQALAGLCTQPFSGPVDASLKARAFA